MTYGITFKKMFNLFPTLRKDYSSNRFSELKRAELYDIAKELKADDAWTAGNYTNMKNSEIALAIYNCIKNA